MNETRIRKDFDQRKLTIERCFDAPLWRVWQACTDPALLDRWWAPKPWRTRTLHMDFQPGGYWHYAMNGPDGEQHFGRMDFSAIEQLRHYRAIDVFADASGAAVPDMPKQTFLTNFAEDGDSTRLVVAVEYETVEDLKKVLEMGMEQGITMTHEQLARLLSG
jgi:uncharacterized protein YndB with AHSA1/START domain